ncbi:steroid 3-ketoacyl-CoA thiolase [Micromonospora sp. S4605]|uniref:steroid 3-ketoacyl-CoA thiolase n=1 Tax=Micromonospora sp. S4605 TaxID=1420897 RepID=UPI000D6EB2F2|nr:steroid 3-ketoacyl-CoA thiolase [Micromonospora sp. S4605]PWU50587.1 steroid 3-ketoacyl-CoA thiolase [Micromonospora sp. S4605]
MTDAVIVDAVRTPIGRRDGALSTVKPVALLRHVLLGLIERTGVDPAAVEQVIGGCVSQVGEQGLGVTRNAWLATGLDPGVGCTTVDVSCGSAQQANHLVAALIATGAIEVGIACGVESMSRVPAGANAPGGVDEHKLPDYPWDDPPGVQFGGAERIARREGLTRADLDGYGALSQQRAARAWAHGRYAAEVLPLGGLARDEGLRPTTVETLAGLRPVMRGGLHTAGSTSQVSDGAAAVLWMSRRRADELGLRPRARLLHQVVTGADPYFLLDGPTVATRRILDRAGLKLADLDVVEVNEAFAAVVLSWARHHGADLGRVNVNGGAIALGHPMGATGARLLTTALHELERIDGELALVTMCCGGSQGTASVLQRIAG